MSCCAEPSHSKLCNNVDQNQTAQKVQSGIRSTFSASLLNL